MSFYKQPLAYQCGPFALKYALVMLGQMQDEKEIENVAGSTWWKGTDENGLKKAAKKYDCYLKELYIEKNTTYAIKQLNKHLNKKHPVILCVDKWGHWITVMKHEHNKYICSDSGLKKVITILTEEELIRRWKYYSENTTIYSGYAVIPNYTLHTVAKFDLSIAQTLMTDKYETLALNWDLYFNILSEFAKSPTANSIHILSFKKYLQRNQNLIVDTIHEWHEEIPKKELKDILNNFLFIMNIYNMVIHEDDEKSATAILIYILTMYAAETYGISSYL